jgi:hypothetical protein
MWSCFACFIAESAMGVKINAQLDNSSEYVNAVQM